MSEEPTQRLPMRMFQITEYDLRELEAILPLLAQSLTPTMQNFDRVRLRRVQRILSEVRWNYGPPTDVEIIDGR